MAAFESLLILTANTFTVNIFWCHQNKLKRISYLLINLAVADLLIGFTKAVAIGTYGISLFYSDLAKNTQCGNVSTAFQAMFIATSVVCLVLVYIDLPIFIIVVLGFT